MVEDGMYRYTGGPDKPDAEGPGAHYLDQILHAPKIDL